MSLAVATPGKTAALKGAICCANFSLNPGVMMKSAPTFNAASNSLMFVTVPAATSVFGNSFLICLIAFKPNGECSVTSSAVAPPSMSAFARFNAYFSS